MPVAGPERLPSPSPAPSRRIGAAAVLLTATVLGACVLGSCASTDSAAGGDRDGQAGSVSADADPAPIVETITAVIDASNAEDADAFRALVCRAEVGRFADLVDADPVDDPVRLTDVTVVSQGTDSAAAEVVLTTGEGAAEITQVMRMDLVREDGDWKFCTMALVG